MLLRNGTKVDRIHGRAPYDRPSSNVQVRSCNHICNSIPIYLPCLFTGTWAGCYAPSYPVEYTVAISLLAIDVRMLSNIDEYQNDKVFKVQEYKNK